jgi:hypothetical protein
LDADATVNVTLLGIAFVAVIVPSNGVGCCGIVTVVAVINEGYGVPFTELYTTSLK